MKAQTVNISRKAQEYLTVGAVIAAAGVMFIAGSLQLTAQALHYTRVLAVTMVVLGSILIGLGLGSKPRLAPVLASAPSKASTGKATSKKRNGKKK